MSNWPQPYGPHQQVPATHVHLPPVHRSSTAHLVFAWLAAALTLGYMLPWAIAATRNRTNCAAIALINLFFGWSLIGWVIALVMACGSEPQPVVVQMFPPQPYAPAPYPGHGPTANAGHPPDPSPGAYPIDPAYPAAPTYSAPAALPAAQPRAAEVTMPLPTYPPGWSDRPEAVDPRRPGDLR